MFLLAIKVTAFPTSLGESARPVVIYGKVISPKQNSSILLSINRLGFRPEELTARLDTAGYFSFRFTTYVPTDAWIDYQTNFLILIHPGDSLYIEFDASADDRAIVLKNAIFKGDASAINRQAALFQQLYYASPIYNYDYDQHQNRIRNSTPDQYLAYCDSLRKVGIDFQNAFVKKEKPGKEVSNWSRRFIERGYYFNASYYPEAHREALVLKKSDWDVPADYYNFLLSYPDIAQSLISADAIDGYIGWYTYRCMAGKAQHDLAALKRSMSVEQRDSIIIQHIVKDSKHPMAKEISLCFFLNDLLEQSAIGTFEKHRAIAEANITHPFLREPLFEKYAQKKKETDGKGLPNIEKLSSGIAFLDSIIQNNKGKVIYIDIWATWCGPCRAEFPYANKLEDALADSVVFLYLCLDSNKNAFDNLVSKLSHKGIHGFLDENQSQLLKQKYNIDGFPDYMLIDKDGNIAYRGHSIRPSEDETESLIRALAD
jgi:thiol-disulfide isomerase/thioredoxin